MKFDLILLRNFLFKGFFVVGVLIKPLSIPSSPSRQMSEAVFPVYMPSLQFAILFPQMLQSKLSYTGAGLLMYYHMLKALCMALYHLITLVCLVMWHIKSVSSKIFA